MTFKNRDKDLCNSSNEVPRSIVDIELNRYFLGGRSITTKRVAHLLVSSSFGANAILYAAWLGYVMGIWAIFIQLAWCLSFLLLSKFAKRIYEFTSLHDFLGCQFGKSVQKIAALCSVIGLLYFAGWEISIAKSGLASLGMNEVPWIFITAVFIIIALIYTSVGGQKLNSIVDSFLNIFKFALLVIVVTALTINLGVNGQIKFDLIIPPFSVGIGALGFLGVLTNIVFNLSWQFVDNTTWQSISSNSSSDSIGLRKSLFNASSGVFLTVAVLGTILGALLRIIQNLSSDNILGAVASGMPGTWSIVVAIAIAGLLLFSMMSLVDGVSLSVAQSVIVDAGLIKQKYLENQRLGLRGARILTILMGVLAAWGVQLFRNLLGGSIFDFVYILIVAQLSLLGPVVVGLICKPKDSKNMWIAIVLPIILGMGASILGAIFKANEFVDAAGTISALSSIILALIIHWIHKNKKICGMK